ncbi:MAG TPA: hypothetical protein VF267_08785, partial [Gammaproteobacteria bacterium]
MTSGFRRANLWNVAALLIPLLFAWQLARIMPESGRIPGDIALKPIAYGESAELAAVFEALGYRWPPLLRTAESFAGESGVVPPIAVNAMPVDLHTLSVDERKSIFFRILAPLIAVENRHLLEQREFLQDAFARFPRLPASGPVASRARAIASRFNIGGDLDDPENRALLLRRVDALPAALILAQAANE